MPTCRSSVARRLAQGCSSSLDTKPSRSAASRRLVAPAVVSCWTRLPVPAPPARAAAAAAAPGPAAGAAPDEASICRRSDRSCAAAAGCCAPSGAAAAGCPAVGPPGWRLSHGVGRCSVMLATLSGRSCASCCRRLLMSAYPRCRRLSQQPGWMTMPVPVRIRCRRTELGTATAVRCMPRLRIACVTDLARQVAQAAGHQAVQRQAVLGEVFPTPPGPTCRAREAAPGAGRERAAPGDQAAHPQRRRPQPLAAGGADAARLLHAGYAAAQRGPRSRRQPRYVGR
jgi:hypothetical protein